MSGTEKDKPSKFKFPNYNDRSGKEKQPKKKDTEWHWMSTPAWWTRLMMNRPQRAAGRVWEKKVLKAADIEDVDKPSVSKKPHQYFW